MITIRVLAGAAVAAAALGLAAAPAEATEQRFVLSEDGLGPIRRGAPVDLEALRSAYPEFAFRRGEVMREGHPEPRIFGFRDGAAVIEIGLDGRGAFYDILSTAPRIVGPFGGRIGVSLQDLPIAGAKDCFALAEGSPFTACPSAKTPGLQFLFRLPNRPPRPEDPVSALRLY